MVIKLKIHSNDKNRITLKQQKKIRRRKICDKKGNQKSVTTLYNNHYMYMCMYIYTEAKLSIFDFEFQTIFEILNKCKCE